MMMCSVVVALLFFFLLVVCHSCCGSRFVGWLCHSMIDTPHARGVARCGDVSDVR